MMTKLVVMLMVVFAVGCVADEEDIASIEAKTVVGRACREGCFSSYFAGMRTCENTHAGDDDGRVACQIQVGETHDRCQHGCDVFWPRPGDAPGTHLFTAGGEEAQAYPDMGRECGRACVSQQDRGWADCDRLRVPQGGWGRAYAECNDAVNDRRDQCERACELIFGPRPRPPGTHL